MTLYGQSTNRQVRRRSTTMDKIRINCNNGEEFEASGTHRKYCPRIDPNRYPGAVFQGILDPNNKCVYYFKSVYKKARNLNPLCPDGRGGKKYYYWCEIEGSSSKVDPDFMVPDVISSDEDTDPYAYIDNLIPIESTQKEERAIRESFSRIGEVLDYVPYEDVRDKSLMSFMLQLRPKKNVCPPTQVEICTQGQYYNFYFRKCLNSRSKRSTRVNILYSRKKDKECYKNDYIHDF